jgi:hypothetical protein
VLGDVRWSPAILLLLPCACSSSSSGGLFPTGPTDAGEDSTVAASDDAGDAQEDVLDAEEIPDVTCVVPTAATGATSSRCTPDGPGSWMCEGSSAQGWLYSCQQSASGTYPAGVGACSAFGSYAYFDASYVVALCASAACTPAAQYDVYCDGGSAVACPAFDAAAPASACTPSYIGQWSSGQGEPGPLYCCP